MLVRQVVNVCPMCGIEGRMVHHHPKGKKVEGSPVSNPPSNKVVMNSVQNNRHSPGRTAKWFRSTIVNVQEVGGGGKAELGKENLLCEIWQKPTSWEPTNCNSTLQLSGGGIAVKNPIRTTCSGDT